MSIRKGTPVYVQFALLTPIDAESIEQLEEWIKYNLHVGGCANDNPFLDFDMDAQWRSIVIEVVK